MSTYRSAATRGKFAIGFLVAVAVAEVLVALWEGVGLLLTNLLFSTGPYSDDELAIVLLWSAMGLLLAVGFLGAFLGAAASFLAWHSRTVDNIPALGLGTPVQTPRWSIAWWFIPIANLVLPYRSVADAARRMAPPGVSRDRLVLGWWGLFIASGFFSGVYGNLPSEARDEWVTSGVMGIIASVVTIAAAVAAIRVIRTLQRDADQLALWGVTPVAGQPHSAARDPAAGSAPVSAPPPPAADPERQLGMGGQATALGAGCLVAFVALAVIGGLASGLGLDGADSELLRPLGILAIGAGAGAAYLVNRRLRGR